MLARKTVGKCIGVAAGVTMSIKGDEKDGVKRFGLASSFLMLYTDSDKAVVLCNRAC